MPEIDTKTALNSLGLPKKPEDTRVVVAMSGGQALRPQKLQTFAISRKPGYNPLRPQG